MAVNHFIPSNYSQKPTSGKVSWQSPSNIALVKYWGKYGEQLPTNPSISLTLSNCHTRTSLHFEPKDSEGFEFEVFLEGKRAKSFEPKIQQFFERVEKYLPFLKEFKFRIETVNSFPHSSGIASSASGMSALALCLMEIERKMDPCVSHDYFNQKASFLARLGSGSACRSIKGPLIVWGEHPEVPESSNLFGVKYKGEIHPVFTDFKDAILLVDKGEKQVSSSIGHNLMTDHPFAKQRFVQANQNLTKMIPILKSGDLQDFIKIIESEALSLHAMMMTSMPYFILMKPHTLEIINRIWRFREETGCPVCFTLDAGANVHVLYPNSEAEMVESFIDGHLTLFCKDREYIKDKVGLGAERL